MSCLAKLLSLLISWNRHLALWTKHKAIRPNRNATVFFFFFSGQKKFFVVDEGDVWQFCALFVIGFRARDLCKRPGWRDVMHAVRIACCRALDDHELILVFALVIQF